MTTDHKAAKEWANDNTVGVIHPGPSDLNLAACYLEVVAENERLRELARAAMWGDENGLAHTALRKELEECHDH